MIPRCPKCGEPARFAAVVAKTLCTIEGDGTLVVVRGSVVEATGDIEYQCGGAHRWVVGEPEIEQGEKSE